jgi:hypothetical protein
MTLTAGCAVRFKGPKSEESAIGFAESLRGYASRNGSKVVITKTTLIKIKVCPNGSEPQRGAPIAVMRTSLGGVVDLTAHRNSHGE